MGLVLGLLQYGPQHSHARADATLERLPSCHGRGACAGAAVSGALGAHRSCDHAPVQPLQRQRRRDDG